MSAFSWGPSWRRYIGLFGFWLIRKACGSPGGAWIREVTIHGPCPPLRPLDPKKPLVVYNLSLDGGDTEKFYPGHRVTDMTRFKSRTEARAALGLPRLVFRDNPCDPPPGLEARLEERT